MRVAMEHERARVTRSTTSTKESRLRRHQPRPHSGELRLIEVKGIGAQHGDDRAYAQRAARGRRPSRLLLALRCHELLQPNRRQDPIRTRSAFRGTRSRKVPALLA